MSKSIEAVKYMIDVWDEVTGKTWRQRPDHVQQKFLEAERELLNIDSVSKCTCDIPSNQCRFCEQTKSVGK